jgi:hypothetical protein
MNQNELIRRILHVLRWRILFWILVVVGSGVAKALLPRSGDIAFLTIPVVLAIGLIVGEHVKLLAVEIGKWSWEQDVLTIALSLITAVISAITMLLTSILFGRVDGLYNRWGSYFMGELVALGAFGIVLCIRIHKDWESIRQQELARRKAND